MLYLVMLTLSLPCLLSGCNNTDNKQVEEKPLFDIAPQRAELQKAKELETKMHENAEKQRKAIELQTNPQ